MTDMRLCYVRGSFAYFTSGDLQKQWGDDWNDIPYEHNAGEPYWTLHNGSTWEILKVAWEGPLETPADIARGNSGYSVEMINRHETPWLITDDWSDVQVSIWAGATLEKFTELVEMAGGAVYFAKESTATDRTLEKGGPR